VNDVSLLGEARRHSDGWAANVHRRRPPIAVVSNAQVMPAAPVKPAPKKKPNTRGAGKASKG
jgi:hypothetical protein